METDPTPVMIVIRGLSATNAAAGSRFGRETAPAHRWICSSFDGTTAANELVGRVHDRMPVILARGDYARWLDPTADRDALQALLRPFPADRMESWAVSVRVNRGGVEGAELAEPLNSA